jgi:hypothetical protein
MTIGGAPPVVGGGPKPGRARTRPAGTGRRLRRMARFALLVIAVVVVAAACPSTGGPDAGPTDGFRDENGNLNGTAGVDKAGSDCPLVEFNLELCRDDPDAACHSDDDCTAAGTRCYPHQPHCECRPTCLHDADCGAGRACACDSDACVTALCRSNDDCGSGHCGAVQEAGGCREILGFKCRSVTDVCDSDDDCPAAIVGDPVCVGADAGFVCGTVSGDPCN